MRDEFPRPLKTNMVKTKKVEDQRENYFLETIAKPCMLVGRKFFDKKVICEGIGHKH